MPLFRKKPVVIEAFKWTGGPDQEHDPVWIVDAIKAGTVQFTSGVRNCSDAHPEGFDYPVMLINTLEGQMSANIGEWIIKGVKGELYPCKPDIFEATYEPVWELDATLAQEANMRGQGIAV